MKYAVNLNAVLPVRKEHAEVSEMVTQLLFGEWCEILQESNTFCRIKNFMDSYEGWVDKKMLTRISENEYLSFTGINIYKTKVPCSEIFCLNSNTTFRLSLGSLLHGYEPETGIFRMAGYQFKPSSEKDILAPVKETDKNNILLTALLLLETPYLWGGKSIFGIDCSGFAQLIYSLNGVQLPRDASMQAGCGKAISFCEAEKGDLFFFAKEGKITHVGIYMGENKIIHASGKVRIDKVDEKGIYMQETLTYTHYLAVIRHII